MKSLISNSSLSNVFFFTVLLLVFLVSYSAKAGSSTHHSGQWINSDELKPGMKILTADNKLLVVERSWDARPQKATTYNFEVKDSHTYFVEKSNMWAHNMGNCDEKKPKGIFSFVSERWNKLLGRTSGPKKVYPNDPAVRPYFTEEAKAFQKLFGRGSLENSIVESFSNDWYIMPNGSAQNVINITLKKGTSGSAVLMRYTQKLQSIADKNGVTFILHLTDDGIKTTSIFVKNASGPINPGGSPFR